MRRINESDGVKGNDREVLYNMYQVLSDINDSIDDLYGLADKLEGCEELYYKINSLPTFESMFGVVPKMVTTYYEYGCNPSSL